MKSNNRINIEKVNVLSSGEYTKNIKHKNFRIKSQIYLDQLKNQTERIGFNLIYCLACIKM